MTRVYKYKTLRGLLANQAGQITAENLFNNRRIYKTRRGWCSFELSEEATREAAEMFANYLYKKGERRDEVAEGLARGWGNLSLFQCFYISYSKKYGVHFSNSLSGDAFNYCRRKYLR